MIENGNEKDKHGDEKGSQGEIEDDGDNPLNLVLDDHIFLIELFCFPLDELDDKRKCDDDDIGGES